MDKFDQLQDTINVKLYLRIYNYHLKARKILHLMSPKYFVNSCVSFQPNRLVDSKEVAQMHEKRRRLEQSYTVKCFPK